MQDKNILIIEHDAIIALDLKRNFEKNGFQVAGVNFTLKEALEKIKKQGINRKVVALELQERGIARAGYLVFDNEQEIGIITTGYLIPGHEKALAFAMLNNGYWELGTKVKIQIRKNLVDAVVRNKKFLNKKYIK